jgi:hypothetical protein
VHPDGIGGCGPPGRALPFSSRTKQNSALCVACSSHPMVPGTAARLFWRAAPLSIGETDSPLEGTGFELPVCGRGQSGCRPFYAAECSGRVGAPSQFSDRQARRPASKPRGPDRRGRNRCRRWISDRSSAVPVIGARRYAHEARSATARSDCGGGSRSGLPPLPCC